MMKRLLLATAMLATMAFAGTASAQSLFDLSAPPVGKAAGTFMFRVRAIGVIPEDNGSSVSGIGGHVDVTATAAPEIDASYFFTDNIAAELIAASTRHEVSATGTALGKVDVGSAWILPPTLTLQYHFMPHSQFSPYIGSPPGRW
jgi:outer membrane protein